MLLLLSCQDGKADVVGVSSRKAIQHLRYSHLVNMDGHHDNVHLGLALLSEDLTS